MTNTKLLKERIEKSGLKTSYIAECIGISRQCLWRKVTGRVQFTQVEIAALCKVLGIKTLSEKEEIFFAEKVD